MTVDSFFVNEMFTVNQNAFFYAENNAATTNEYDYIFDVNISAVVADSLTGLSTMNDLFNVRHFKQNRADQNTTNENRADVDIEINFDSLNNLLHTANAVAISSTRTDVVTTYANIYGTLSPGENRLGLRFLEVVATKVFGHAKARAAIANDTDFYRPLSSAGSMIEQIAYGMDNAVINFRNTIFNMYVAYDRIQLNNENDVDQVVNFNFENTIFEFPIKFRSFIQDDGSDNANMSLVNNGPIVGGAQLQYGLMEVPILVRFHGGTVG
jgi:hypothetical protein